MYVVSDIGGWLAASMGITIQSVHATEDDALAAATARHEGRAYVAKEYVFPVDEPEKRPRATRKSRHTRRTYHAGPLAPGRRTQVYSTHHKVTLPDGSETWATEYRAKRPQIEPYAVPRERYDLLERGEGVGALRYSPEYGGSKTSITIYDTRLTPYLGNLKPGAVVIDKRELRSHPMFVRWVLGCPMVDLSLKGSETDPIDRDAAARMAPALEGAFGTLAEMAASDPDYTGLDHVSLDAYVAWWRKRGAKIGKRKGNRIAWEDGSFTQIPTEALRYASDE